MLATACCSRIFLFTVLFMCALLCLMYANNASPSVIREQRQQQTRKQAKRHGSRRDGRRDMPIFFTCTHAHYTHYTLPALHTTATIAPHLLTHTTCTPSYAHLPRCAHHLLTACLVHATCTRTPHQPRMPLHSSGGPSSSWIPIMYGMNSAIYSHTHTPHTHHYISTCRGRGPLYTVLVGEHAPVQHLPHHHLPCLPSPTFFFLISHLFILCAGQPVD